MPGAARPPEAVAASGVLGLDIGGTKLAAGVVDATGGVRSFVVAPSREDPGLEPALERLWALGRQAVAESGLDWPQIEAVGIACGGPLDRDLGTVSPVHLPEWRRVPIVALAEAAYDHPAALDNDATAAAAGEHRFGAGAGARNMVYLTISTGVGGGVVMDGEVYRGAAGNGGELGHITVDWRGRPCRGCGRRGCLEAYVSGTSIVERAVEAGVSGFEPRSLTASDVVEAARAGDPVALAVWEETIEALACGVTSLVNAFEPELVVLGGGVTRAGRELIDPVRERVRAEAMGPAADAVEVVPAALGDRVGVVGAAAIAYEEKAASSGGRVRD